MLLTALAWGSLSLPSRAEAESVEAEPKPRSKLEWSPLLDVRARGEARVRPYVDGQNPERGDYFAVTRLRAGLGGRLGVVGARVEIQDARRLGLFPSQAGSAGFGIHAGYVEIGDLNGTSLRVGRQELSLGDQRMIGPLDWLMQARRLGIINSRFPPRTDPRKVT